MGRPGEGRIRPSPPTETACRCGTPLHLGVPLRHAIKLGRAAAARPFVGLRSQKGVARPKKRACPAHTPFFLGVGVGVREKKVLRVSKPEILKGIIICYDFESGSYAE